MDIERSYIYIRNEKIIYTIKNLLSNWIIVAEQYAIIWPMFVYMGETFKSLQKYCLESYNLGKHTWEYYI